jgi:putative ABC transport system permease protein
MLRNFWTIAYRNVVRNKFFSLVNIFGLAIGMAACWFIFEYVRFELSYDRWHKNAARLYRVPLDFAKTYMREDATGDNYPAVGPTLAAEFPEVVDFARLAPASLFIPNAMLSYTNERGQTSRFNETKIYLADPSFLTLFSFPFLSGDPASALVKARSMVISASLAKKYFGADDPVGKTLVLNGGPLIVTGVFCDVAENSHVHFDALVSFNTLREHFNYTDWEAPGYYNYVLLAPHADPQKLEAKFPALIEKYVGKKEKALNLNMQFHLEPVIDIHLQPTAAEEEAQGSMQMLYLLSALGLFILAIAWINYINLSTAKSIERAREVGVRKVAGASRLQLAGQFMLESMLVNLLALVLTIIIVGLTGPYFDRFVGKGISRAFYASGLLLNWRFWLIVSGAFLLGALQVGAYPALVLSAFKPVLVLKGRFQRSGKGLFLRRVLVTFQFLLSILLVAASLIVYRQLQFMRNQDPGFNKNQLLMVRAPALADSTFTTRVTLFKTELMKDPAIKGVAPSSEIPGQPMGQNNGIRRVDRERAVNRYADFLAIDSDFVPTYGVKLLAGTNLPDEQRGPGDWFHTRREKVMINEVLAKQLGYRDAAAAIHQEVYFITWVGDIRGEIVGVVKNYQVQSVKAAYQPMLFYHTDHIASTYFAVNVDARSLRHSLAKVEAVYNKSFPGNAYESFFLNEHFEKQYRADQKLGGFFQLFTGLAIFVACMGLLGLSSLIIRLRVREIGIRKVLGAPVYSLLVLLSKDFVRMVVIAAAIALPIVYWGADRWLSNYAFHIRVGWVLLLAPPMLLLTVALATVSVQSLRAALANPVDSLKVE